MSDQSTQQPVRIGDHEQRLLDAMKAAEAKPQPDEVVVDEEPEPVEEAPAPKPAKKHR